MTDENLPRTKRPGPELPPANAPTALPSYLQRAREALDGMEGALKP
jgi:hypothetical protein